MSYQVIRQPDGQLAIFSSYTDTVVMWDATAGDIEEWFVDLAIGRMKREIGPVLEHVAAGNPSEVYHQFAKTWAEALESDREHGGEAHKVVHP